MADVPDDRVPDVAASSSCTSGVPSVWSGKTRHSENELSTKNRLGRL